MATIVEKVKFAQCNYCHRLEGDFHTEWCVPGVKPYGRQVPFESKEDWYGIENNVVLREVLLRFAEAMELKLRKNDHKTGWRDLPIQAIFAMLMVEIEEFKIAHQYLSRDEARKELVDISNFAMIMHDRIGMEEDKNNGVTK